MAPMLRHALFLLLCAPCMLHPRMSSGQGFIVEIGPPLAQDGIGVAALSDGFLVGARLHAREPQRHMAGLWRFTPQGAPVALDTVPGLDGNAFPQALAHGDDGSCFLVGSVIPPQRHDHEPFVAKRAPDGSIAWIARPQLPGSHQLLGVRALPDGGALACGVASAGMGHDAFIARFAPDGSLAWSLTEGTELDEEAHAILLVGDAIIVTGRQVNFGGTSDAWFARLDPDGTLAWTTSWGGVGNEAGYGLAPLGNAAFVMAGTSDSYGPFDMSEQRRKSRAYLLALDLQGDSLWTRAYGDTLYDQRAFGIAAAANGDLLICGERTAVIGAGDAFAARISPAGTLLWQRTWDLGKEERLLAVSALPDGLITTGWAFGELARQVVLIRRDPGGN